MRIISNIHKLGIAVIVLLCSVTQFSCSKWDDFKEYTKDGEIVYTGKLDSVEVFSGKGRVMLRGEFNADPKIRMTKIYWNDYKDSIEFQTEEVSKGAIFEKTFAVDEGVKSFVIYNYDGAGNRSVAVNAVGTSFGSAYRRKINNRLVSLVNFDADGVTINWEAMDLSTGPQYTELEYALNGETKHMIIPISEASTRLEGLSTTTQIKYRTIFKPEESSIDTFAVAYKNYEIKFIPRLKNNRVPFIAASRKDRWGTLADWITNDAAKIHAGGHGGWDDWNGNIFNLESGWGAPAIINGKVYQSLELEPGTYTFEISDLMNTNLTQDDNAYLVVALGNTLPDVELVTTAIGYVKVVEGKPVGELHVKFTLTETSLVSMGFLTTQPGDTPGRFCNIRAFDFYQN
ncbi:DUF5013 domain-containing protein [Pontibacter sp. E15-1]|uniref:DUF4998 domain-containing protein n=1 Tax=Pontibacter sp. E15-1 TaxID=2919918 RepID=UPI001F4FB284|nr:DUF4998 domain-containing protein [Pontibacter sp. E15-1]MCJ8164316.1 DUF5013 domain-containing protein [Pontibacter sp. E15-1]